MVHVATIILFLVFLFQTSAECFEKCWETLKFQDWKEKNMPEVLKSGYGMHIFTDWSGHFIVAWVASNKLQSLSQHRTEQDPKRFAGFSWWRPIQCMQVKTPCSIMGKHENIVFEMSYSWWRTKRVRSWNTSRDLNLWAWRDRFYIVPALRMNIGLVFGKFWHGILLSGIGNLVSEFLGLRHDHWRFGNWTWKATS